MGIPTHFYLEIRIIEKFIFRLRFLRHQRKVCLGF